MNQEFLMKGVFLILVFLSFNFLINAHPVDVLSVQDDLNSSNDTLIPSLHAGIVTEKPIHFFCVSGVLCRMKFITRTGRINDAIPTSLSIAALHDAELWMNPARNKTVSGVPLVEGDFQYILGYLDSNRQNCEIPFNVAVVKSPLPNHKFTIIMDTPSPREFRKSPRLRTNFVRDLSKALKRPVSSITVDHIWLWKNKTALSFYINTFSVSKCDRAGINEMKSKMILSPGKKVKATFIRDMGTDYYIRSVTMSVLTNCREDIIILPLEKFTTLPTDIENPWNTVLKVLIGLFSFLIITSVCVIICCFWPSKKPNKPKQESIELRSDMQHIVEWVENGHHPEDWSRAAIEFDGNNPFAESEAPSDALSGISETESDAVAQ